MENPKLSIPEQLILDRKEKNKKDNSRPVNWVLQSDKIIEKSELRKLLRCVEKAKDEAIRSRKYTYHIKDYYMYLLTSLTGLRSSEIANLRVQDVSDKSIKVTGKGRRIRVLDLGPRCRKCIAEFWELKQEVLNETMNDNDYFFLNQARNKFDRIRINKRFKTWCRKADISIKLTFHSLRHYFATLLLNEGFNVAEVSRMLGHVNVQTTSCYLHYTEETKGKIDRIL